RNLLEHLTVHGSVNDQVLRASAIELSDEVRPRGRGPPPGHPALPVSEGTECPPPVRRRCLRRRANRRTSGAPSRVCEDCSTQRAGTGALEPSSSAFLVNRSTSRKKSGWCVRFSGAGVSL